MTHIAAPVQTLVSSADAGHLRQAVANERMVAQRPVAAIRLHRLAIESHPVCS